MKKYKLVLATEDGEVLDTWILSPRSAEYPDFVYPLGHLAGVAIIEDINKEIEKHESKS